MKKTIASLVLVTSLWSGMVTSTNIPVDTAPITASGTAQVGNLHVHTQQPVIATQSMVGNATDLFAEHKQAVALLAVAITIGLSLKYCSWVQGLVGIDTEAEIDDWRVFIQE